MSDPAVSDRADAAAAPAGELMNHIYARQRHVYDLTRRHFLLGRDRLIRELQPPSGGTVLEVGCGTGRNLVTAARSYPDAHFFGLDISTKMLATARANIRSARLEGRVALGCADATDFDPEHLFRVGHFDRVFFSYSLSMIPAWQDALRRAHRVIEPEDGRLLVVDFGQQERLPAWFRRNLFDWLQRFHVTPRADLEDALATLSKAAGGRLVFRHLYRGYASLAEVSR